MALQRILCAAARRSYTISSSTTVFNRSLFGGEKYYPNPLEHASGLEKKQLLAELTGNDDPFDMSIEKRGACTKENPHVVLSAYHERLMGCICEEDSENVVWMWLRQNEPKRCACGYWFKLAKREPL